MMSLKSKTKPAVKHGQALVEFDHTHYFVTPTLICQYKVNKLQNFKDKN